MTKIHNRLDSWNSRPGPKHNADAKNASADSESKRVPDRKLMLQPNLQELLRSKLEGPASVQEAASTPIPAKGKSVSVTGFLTGVECNDDKTVKYFLIDVETVTFLGQASGATVPRAEESPTKITDGTPAKLKFTGFFGGDGCPAKGGEPPSK
ncbi:hypothetical protein B0H14DRAFT_2641569 [Mycena olivaceomarginata]|nr:hypothetical protein B0H14DRAFT_2641569 [Mycena olivaceomarginata]